MTDLQGDVPAVPSIASSPDPAEVVVNPVEQFAKKVVFQAPAKQGGQNAYTHYMNLVVNHAVPQKNTTISGPGSIPSGMFSLPVTRR